MTMQNKFLAAIIVTALTAAGVRADETNATATIAQPTPIAQAATPAPAPAPAPAAAAAVLPAPNQVIYAPRLPSAEELTNTASAQGLTVVQINQTNNQVTVVYRTSEGQTTVVAYQLLPTQTAGAVPTVVTPSPAPTVVYQTAPSVIYYESPRPYYYPRYYYPPVSLQLGFGYSSYRGGWGGGHHHWR